MKTHSELERQNERRTVKYDGDDPEAFYATILHAFDGKWAKVTVQVSPRTRQTYEGYITGDGNCVVIEPDNGDRPRRKRLISVVRITF